MNKKIKRLELDVFFNRDATTPTIPNKIAQIKDYLAINCPKYYNSVKFVGGYKVKEQNQSVANFVIFTEDVENIKNKFLKVFKDQDVYLSEDNKIPIIQ